MDEEHAWKDLGICFRLCSRCGRPDVGAVRCTPCHPRPEAAAVVARRLALARRFWGQPASTLRPMVSKAVYSGQWKE